MDFQSYLESRSFTDAQFALLVGRDRTQVLRWRRRQTIPGAAAMRRIAEVTSGAVTPNDFLRVVTPSPSPSPSPSPPDQAA